MNIKIEDYLSQNEIENIARDELRLFIRSAMKDETNIKRIISNSAYDIVSKMVDEIFNEDLETILAIKVKEIIGKMSHYTIFKKPDAWDRESNSAYKVLQREIEAGTETIKQIVKDKITIETMKELKGNINDKIQEAIIEFYGVV